MNIVWYPVDRQELAQSLLSDALPAGFGRSDPRSADSDVALGIREAGRNGHPLVAVALLGSKANALLSWIATYAEEAFPLSQFCRVCSVDDWMELELQERSDPAVGAVDPMWPSLVLGELLGQSEGDLDVGTAPIARATACFSYAMARTVLLYPGHRHAETQCLRRLSLLERETRFARRLISVESLRGLWSTARSLQDLGRDSIGLDSIFRVVAAVDRQAAELLHSDLLLSDSAEDRVIGFDAIVDRLFERERPGRVVSEGVSATLAAATILAGRGTSHIQLLAPAAKRSPQVLVWFGLFAGLLGPQAWDKAWAQQARGVERSLRQFFRADQPVTADLCWPEFEWLSRTYDTQDVFSALPKHTQRSLAIELLPGVDCQLRLIGGASSARSTDERKLLEKELADRTQTISKEDLAQAVSLLSRLQRLLTPPRSDGGQGALFEGEATPKQGKQVRRRPGDKPDRSSGT